MSLTPLGRITRLQIQLACLTVGERPTRRYDPASLLAAHQLHLTCEGAWVVSAEGKLLDVHHTRHPQTRYSDNNTLSFNFTAHYAAMRAEYGAHLWDGCAGENILVETSTRLSLSELAGEVVIRSQHNERLIRLGKIEVAHPCRPFSGYVLGGTEASVKEALQFLDGGTRGFYCTLAQEGEAVLTVGDELMLETRL